MSVNEMCRLQGIDPASISIPTTVSRAQIGAMLGNAMSQHVLEALLSSLARSIDFHAADSAKAAATRHQPLATASAGPPVGSIALPATVPAGPPLR